MVVLAWNDLSECEYEGDIPSVEIKFFNTEKEANDWAFACKNIGDHTVEEVPESV
jgi:hypothetical protein